MYKQDLPLNKIQEFISDETTNQPTFLFSFTPTVLLNFLLYLLTFSFSLLFVLT